MQVEMPQAAGHQIGFGGGCHWCTEAVFASVRGVASVAQGWISAPAPHDDYSEAVVVNYSPSEVPLAVLVEIHVRTHSSASAHALRHKYRSAIYVFNEAQRLAAGEALAKLDRDAAQPLITQVLTFHDFRESPAQYQGYYHTDPERPFCRTYIDPKLAKLRADYAKYANPQVAR